MVFKATKQQQQHMTSPKLPKRIVVMNDSEKVGPVFRVTKNSVTYITLHLEPTTTHHECEMPHTRIGISEFGFSTTRAVLKFHPMASFITALRNHRLVIETGR